MEIRGCPGLVYTSCRQETKPPNKIPQGLDYNMDSSEMIINTFHWINYLIIPAHWLIYIRLD